MTSTPYTIAGQPIEPMIVVRRRVWPVLVVVPVLALVSLIIAGVIVLVVYKGQTR